MNPGVFYRVLGRLSLFQRILIPSALLFLAGYTLLVYTSVKSQMDYYHTAASGEAVLMLDTLEKLTAGQAVIGDYTLIHNLLRDGVKRGIFKRLAFTDVEGHSLVAQKEEGNIESPEWFNRWLDITEQPVLREITVGGRIYGTISAELSHAKFHNQTWESAVKQIWIALVGGIVFFVSVALIIRSSLKPLRSVQEIARKAASGDVSVRAQISDGSAPEIREAITLFNEATASIDYHLRERIEELLHKLAEHNEQLKQTTQEAETKYRAIFENSIEGIFQTTQEGRYINVNPAMASIHGYERPDDMINSVSDIGREIYVDPSRREELTRLLSTNDTVSGFEFQARKKNGDIIWVSLNARAVRDAENKLLYIEGFVTDINERKKAESRLLKETIRADMLLKLYAKSPLLTDKQLYSYALDQAVSLTDSAIGFFHLVSDNQKNVILTAWNNEALKNCAAVYDTHYSIDKAGNWVDCIRLKQPVVYNNFEASPNRKGLPDGHTPVKRFMSIPVMEGDKIKFIFGVGNKGEVYDDNDIMHIQIIANELQHIINQRHAEDMLREAQEELVRKEKLSILGRLAGIVGHEIRNPLGVMNNAVYFLKTVMTDANDTVKEYLDIIKQEIDNSQRIITDLLDFARTKTPQLVPVTVNTLITKSLGRCTIPENIDVQTDIPDTLPQVTADPFQMGQVLQNLIINAIQAMPEGGALTIAARQVQSPMSMAQGPEKENLEPATVDHVSDTAFVEISVKDTGEGISPENRDKLFQPLFTTKAKGIGLGLTVCRNLTEANGGRIEVESKPGKGAAFRVLLQACSAC